MTGILRHFIYALTLTLARLWPRSRAHKFRLTILKLDRLGDAVLSLGAVRILVQEFGEKETLLVVSTVAEPLFRLEFPSVELLVLPPFCERYFPDLLRFLWAHAASLRSYSTETLLSLRHQPSDYLHIIAQLLAPKICYTSLWTGVGENVSLAYPRAQHVPYPEVPSEQCLELEAHRRVLGSLLKREVLIAEVMPTLTALRALKGNTLLVCPMAGTAIRHYPPHLLAAAIQLFLKSKDVPVEFCFAHEADIEPWRRAMSEVGVACAQWHVTQTLTGLVHLIAGAGWVLAPDSAPAHIATALDKPGVFLLGGGHFGIFAPWHRSAQQVWLREVMDCYQCRWICHHSEAFCITKIQPQEIANSLVKTCAE
ncbi:MAG: glycosyltransferase family 9 protein [Prosthecobacter sp.]